VTAPLIQIALIILSGFVSQWTAWKLHIPAIVFLLIFGFILGPVTNLVQPELLMGDLLKPAISAAVAIILFEGSLHLKLRDIREVQPTILRIILLGAPLGWLLISSAAHYVAGLTWPVAMTLGGILIVTGPTVITPMLRHARVKQRVGSVLKWEGIINDPVGVIVAVLVYEYFHFSHSAGLEGTVFYAKLATVLVGLSAISYIFGRFSALILERGWVPEYLKAPFLLANVLTIFTICDVLLHESGLIAVTIYGMTLANNHVSSIEEIKRFKETITLLLIAGVFIILTAGLDPSLLNQIDKGGILFVLLVIFLIRPVTVFLSSIGANFSFKERLIVGWIAPRGVVCAAISGVMGLLLIEAGYEDGEKILPLAFGIVLFTVVLHGLTFKPLARLLGLTSTVSNGVIIVGAQDWTIQLAETLRDRDVPVLMIDTNWHRLKPARQAKIPVYYGEILSEETELNLDIASYGTLLAATDNTAYNSFVCNTLAKQMGRENVFQVSYQEERGPEHKKMPNTMRGRLFVDAETNYYDWWHKYRNSWRFKTTRVSTTVDEDEVAGLSGERLKVGVINKNNVLAFVSPEIEPIAKDGEQVLFFEKVDLERKAEEKLQSRNEAQKNGAPKD
jgi:NhaP-type Na+/H+ or K+/H+ antiporter